MSDSANALGEESIVLEEVEQNKVLDRVKKRGFTSLKAYAAKKDLPEQH